MVFKLHVSNFAVISDSFSFTHLKCYEHNFFNDSFNNSNILLVSTCLTGDREVVGSILGTYTILNVD